MLQVKTMIGNSEILYESDGKDLKEDIVRISWLTNAPTKCGICDSPDIFLEGRVTKSHEGEEFVYTDFKCRKCWSTATLGEYKNPKGALFLKKWVKYEKVIDTTQVNE